jgi:serine/threonine protein kinase
MAYLYKSRIEHRDLKSLNVLLTHDSRCKVTDFGLSKCDDLSTAATATVAGGGLAGTPAFMAPELLEDNTFSEKSDVFSYAMVLFEIWSRDVPWSGLQPPQIISKVLVKQARPEMPPSMAPDMAALMAKCWAQDPDARPDFKAIVAELRGSTKSALRGSGAAGERPSQSSWMSSVGSNAQGTTRSLSSWIAAARGSA